MRSNRGPKWTPILALNLTLFKFKRYLKRGSKRGQKEVKLGQMRSKMGSVFDPNIFHAYSVYIDRDSLNIQQ